MAQQVMSLTRHWMLPFFECVGIVKPGFLRSLLRKKDIGVSKNDPTNLLHMLATFKAAGPPTLSLDEDRGCVSLRVGEKALQFTPMAGQMLSRVMSALQDCVSRAQGKALAGLQGADIPIVSKGISQNGFYLSTVHVVTSTCLFLCM